jgi:hypothetical protein
MLKSNRGSGYPIMPENKGSFIIIVDTGINQRCPWFEDGLSYVRINVVKCRTGKPGGLFKNIPVKCPTSVPNIWPFSIVQRAQTMEEWGTISQTKLLERCLEWEARVLRRIREENLQRIDSINDPPTKREPTHFFQFQKVSVTFASLIAVLSGLLNPNNLVFPLPCRFQIL